MKRRLKPHIFCLALLASQCLVGPNDQAVGQQVGSSSSSVTIRGQKPDGSVGLVQISQDGSILTEAGVTVRAAFGETLAVEPTPVFQIAGTYGIRSTDVETFSATGGSATVNDFMFDVQSGTSLGGYGTIRSRRNLHYRPGQGALARFTAMFSTPVALSTQQAGLFTSENALTFGYNGTTFGILRSEGARLEIQTFTVTAAASGNETVTFTLDGVAQSGCAVTSGTVQHNAAELAECSYTGWNAYSNDDEVIFVATAVGDKTSSFSVSSGAGTTDGTFAETVAGVAATDTWVAQSAWNIDTMDGNGSSGMTLDHDTLNVYQIGYQYLGAGAITFSIEDDSTGQFVPVHRIDYTNANTSPHLSNPTMPVGWAAASLGSTGTNLRVRGASAAGFVEGKREPLRYSRGFVSTEAVGSSLEPVLSIRNRAVFADQINQMEVYPGTIKIGVDATGNKPAEVEVLIGADLSGGTAMPLWTYIDETESVVEYDETADGVSGGDRVDACGVAAGGDCEIDLSKFKDRLDRGETLTVAAAFSSGSGDITVSINWLED